jgi:signal transduction histidine kinase
LFSLNPSADASLQPAIDQERRRLFLVGTRRSPFIAILMMTFLTYALAPVIGSLSASLWCGFGVVIFVIRFALSHWILQQAKSTVNEAFVDWFVAGSGLLVALPSFYAILHWFPVMRDLDRAVITVVYVGWVAGGMAAQACYPRWTPYWAAPLILGVVLAWALQGGTLGWGFSAMACVLSILMVGGLLSSAEAINESIRAKLINSRLVDELLAQRSLVEDAARAKTAFLVAAGHDLRQPAMGLGLLISAMQSAPDLSTARTIAERAKRPLAAMERILQSLLEFSKLDSGQVEAKAAPFDLDEMLHMLVDEARTLVNPNVSVVLDSRIGKINADAALFEQVIRNLLSNAARFTSQGRIEVRSSFNSSIVQVMVTDTGVGIAPELQSVIFQEYVQVNTAQRSRTQGLGLGLSIVSKACKLLNATVELQSSIGVGSSFLFRAPAQVISLPSLAAFAGTDVPSVPLRTIPERSILMVDDDALVRESFQIAMETMGYQVVCCASVEAALETMTSDRGEHITHAFIDHQISDNTSGLELIRAIRAGWPQVRCLLVTGDTRKDVAQRALAQEVTVLYKPLRVEKLVEQLAA